MKRVIYGLSLVFVCAALASEASGQRGHSIGVRAGHSPETGSSARTSAKGQPFSPEQISRGADVYATYCMACHGWQMEYPGGSFDLRAFPPGQFERFASAVIKGKNNMPPWGEVLQPGDIEALWAYVMAGERK